MIRHQIYFDTLGSMQEDSLSWRCVFAGLSVLRLVDSYAKAESGSKPGGWAQLHSVRTAIDEMGEGDALRGVLTAILDEVTNRDAIDDNVCRALLSYGRALDYEAKWDLAIDVFSTVAKFAKPERNARLAVEAHVAIGGAARRNGEWDVSARAYSQAAYIADTLGDRIGVLTVQVGIANTYMTKGNLPQAQTILDDVLIQAREHGFSEVQADALHARAALAQRQGTPAEGLKLAYEALRLTSTASKRDFILEDLAALFTEIGLRDAARDAHLVLSTTAQSKLVQWAASVNLMELSSIEGMEEAFNSYAHNLSRAPVGPWIRAHYFLFLGEGLNRFGRRDSAEEVLTKAVAFSEANEIHQIAFKAQAALAAVRSAPPERSTFVAPPTWVPEEVQEIARAMSDLRKAAVAAA
jgi:tetratricopeptide (TPR) repeat protein